MTFSDILSRTLLAPNEISIGIVAAVIGALAGVIVYHKRSKKFYLGK